MASLPHLARAALARDPARPAVEFEGAWLNWGALGRVAEEVSTGLATAGVDPAAPVAFVPRNRPEALAALLALLAEGRSVRMIYPFQSAAGIARALGAARVGAVVMHGADCAGEVCDWLEREGAAAVTLDGMRATVRAVGTRTGGSAGDEATARPVIEILTSGTTGPPKPFALGYDLLERHFVAPAQARTEAGDPGQSPPALLYFALGNITGIYASLSPLLRGQRVVLLERFSIAAWHDYVVRHRPTQSGVPPSFLQQILDLDIPREDLASIRAMGSGTAPLDPQVQRAFEQRYGIPVLVAYGATEFAGPVAMMTAELHAQWGESKRGSVGRALPGVELRIVDPDTGQVLRPGETGLLQVICPRIGAEWITTSDLALIDGDGFLFIQGRADNAIMRGGFKILPETVESALLQHPAIREAAVTAVPHARLGQVPAAVLCVVPGVTPPKPAEIEAHLRRHILATHLPAHWLFCDELPRTPSLKVDRPALRAMVDAHLKQGAR